MTDTATKRLRPVDIGKPRMRGWLHFYAFFGAAAAGIVLITIAAFRPGLTPVVSMTIYSVTVCGLFGVSALYHRRVWTERGYQIMRRLDHAMIYILIAGSYTPFSLLLLSPPMSTIILAIVWGGALAGAIVSLVWPHAPRWISAPIYLALGWVAVVVLPDFLRHGGLATLLLIVAGGAAYTIGAVMYALRWPNPWPATFGHHEFFHACTIVAAVCHHIAAYFALFAV